MPNCNYSIICHIPQADYELCCQICSPAPLCRAESQCDLIVTLRSLRPALPRCDSLIVCLHTDEHFWRLPERQKSERDLEDLFVFYVYKVLLYYLNSFILSIIFSKFCQTLCEGKQIIETRSPAEFNASSKIAAVTLNGLIKVEAASR